MNAAEEICHGQTGQFTRCKLQQLSAVALNTLSVVCTIPFHTLAPSEVVLFSSSSSAPFLSSCPLPVSAGAALPLLASLLSPVS